jgi:hypothetical protein
MTTSKTTTKAQFAHEAAAQLAYILGALGIPDDYNATSALLAALESKGSLKCAAEYLVDCLRTVKIQVRANVNALDTTTADRDKARADSYQASADRNQARAGRKILSKELRRIEGFHRDAIRDRDAARALLQDAIGDRDAAREAENFWFKEAESLGTSYTRTGPENLGLIPDTKDRQPLTVENPTKRERTPNPFKCGCDIEREFCDVCKEPDPRTTDKADAIAHNATAHDEGRQQGGQDTDTADWTPDDRCGDCGEFIDSKDHGDCVGNAHADKIARSPIVAEAKARRRAARQAADDAERARDRSARRQTIRDREARLTKGGTVTMCGHPVGLGYCGDCQPKPGSYRDKLNQKDKED